MKNTNIKKVFIGLIAITLVVLVGFIVLNKTSLLQNNENKLSNRIEEVGSDFYENFYYDQISANKTEEEVKEFLERFEEVGIKVDLDNLSRFNEEKYSNLNEEFKNKKDDIECDIRNTKAIIYPKSPYSKEDYTISHELDCGFDATE